MPDWTLHALLHGARQGVIEAILTKKRAWLQL